MFNYRFNKWSPDASTYRVVGFEVKPISIDRSSLKNEGTASESPCTYDFATKKQQFVSENTREVIFSYDVVWVVRNLDYF